MGLRGLWGGYANHLFITIFAEVQGNSTVNVA